MCRSSKITISGNLEEEPDRLLHILQGESMQALSDLPWTLP